jgi:hypothetical protein
MPVPARWLGERHLGVAQLCVGSVQNTAARGVYDAGNIGQESVCEPPFRSEA